MFPVPNGLAPELAALTEPMAVGWHAVRRGEVKKRDVAIVIGCGPIGLAVICMLKARGVRTVVASDFSPGRRALATAAARTWSSTRRRTRRTRRRRRRSPHDVPDALELAVGTMEKLRRLPVPVAPRLARRREARREAEGPVIFECVGVPGVIDEIIAGAPLFSRVVVVGVCMGARPDPARDGDQQGDRPAVRARLHAARVPRHAPPARRGQGRPGAAGHRDGRPAGVEGAFDALGDPETHAKILIDPKSAAAAPWSAETRG